MSYFVNVRNLLGRLLGKGSAAPQIGNRPPIQAPEIALPPVIRAAPWLITESLKDAFTADLRNKLPANAQPNEEQMQMIFSPNPATCVTAGAGSGKSTCMALRVVFMHVYLKVPLDELTVVTFTRASKFDLTKKLEKNFELWNVSDPEKSSQTVVKTFHALAMGQGLSQLFPGANPFERLDDDTEADNIFDSKLQVKQRNVLRKVWLELYKDSSEFKKLILRLKMSIVDEKKNETRNRKSFATQVESHDKEVAERLTKAWSETMKWPIAGVDATITPVKFVVDGDEVVVYANGYMKEQNAYVFLGSNSLSKSYKTGMVGAKQLQHYCTDRQLLIEHFCKKEFVVVQSPDELELATLEDLVHAPLFMIKLPGDITSASILDSFYEYGSFSDALSADMEASQTNVMAAAVSKNYLAALKIFWPAFEKICAEDRTPTFNQLFQRLATATPEEWESLVGNKQSLSMRNLMIDEFQDISPLILNWVTRTLSELQRHGHPVSLMCVGDTRQSIYGWRGSSPSLMSDFSHYVRSLNPPLLIDLTKNFRSHQHIIDAAESVLAFSDNKSRCFAARTPEQMPRVLIVDEKLASEVYKRHPYPDAYKKLVRRNIDTGMTIHKSKGLEFEHVVIKSNPASISGNDVKAALYASSGLPGNFILAEKAESRRVVYVAITRAAQSCILITKAAVKDDGPDLIKHFSESRHAGYAVVVNDTESLKKELANL